MRVLSTGTGPVRRDGRPRPRRVHHVGRAADRRAAHLRWSASGEGTAGVVVLLDQGERVRLANETSEPVSPLACLPPADFIPCAPQLARLVRGDTWSTRWVGLTVVPPAQDDPAGWATSLASRADWMPCPGHGYWRRGPSARSVTRPHPDRPAR